MMIARGRVVFQYFVSMELYASQAGFSGDRGSSVRR